MRRHPEQILVTEHAAGLRHASEMFLECDEGLQPEARPQSHNDGDRNLGMGHCRPGHGDVNEGRAGDLPCIKDGRQASARRSRDRGNGDSECINRKRGLERGRCPSRFCREEDSEGDAVEKGNVDSLHRPGPVRPRDRRRGEVKATQQEGKDSDREASVRQMLRLRLEVHGEPRREHQQPKKKHPLHGNRPPYRAV